MAEEKQEKGPSRLQLIIRNIRVPKKLVPKKVLRQMEINLFNANISFSATEWIGIFTFAGAFLALVLSVVFSALVGAGAFIFAMALMAMIPKMQADKRRAQVEESLPDALHHMAVSIRTGLVLESVIQEIAESEYGALSEEFSQGFYIKVEVPVFLKKRVFFKRQQPV